MRKEEHVGDARREQAAGAVGEGSPSALVAVTRHNPHELCGPRCSCDYRDDGLPKTSEDRRRDEAEFIGWLRREAK